MDISVVNEMLSTSSPLQLLNAAFPILSIPEGKANEVMPVRQFQVDGDVENSLRNLVLSPIFLTGVIALTAQIVLSIFSTAIGSTYYADLINRILSGLTSRCRYPVS